VRLATWQGETRVLGHGRPGIERLTLSDPYMAPGNWLIGCFDPTWHRAGDTPRNYLKLSLVDPTKAWVSTRLSCETVPALVPSGGSVDLLGVQADRLERALLHRTPGLGPGDTIEPAGYPDDKRSLFRALRRGNVVARFDVDLSADRAAVDGCRGIGPTPR
jgi:hypothetical protein